MESLAYSVTLTTMSCGECGGVYAINEQRRAQCRTEGTGWTCPYCKCSWGYFNNGENARLKRELEQLRKRKEWAEQESRNQRERREATERRLSAQRGVTTRIKNRISKGACPCCNRTFQDLQRHMVRQHPTYAATESENT